MAVGREPTLAVFVDVRGAVIVRVDLLLRS